MNKEPHYTQLVYQDRQTIAVGRQQGLSMRAIARMLGRDSSTISRELARNQPGPHYSCHHAQQRRDRRRRQARPAPKLVASNALFETIAALLRQRWSPRQIAARLAKLHPSDASMRASHETIYNVIYAQPRGELKRELIACLRMARAKRWPRSRGEDRRGQMADLLSIHVRPPEVADRQFPGHWEGDLIKGARNGSAVGTLVERTTRLVLLARMEGTDARSAREGFTKKLRHVPALLRKTLTYDRGKEMAEHEQLAQRLAIQIFFADPYSPWQRGTNENTNGLLRQYLPKGTDLSGYTQRELNAIAHRLNTRPRKCLDFATPLEVYAQLRHHSPVALGT